MDGKYQSWNIYENILQKQAGPVHILGKHIPPRSLKPNPLNAWQKYAFMTVIDDFVINGESGMCVKSAYRGGLINKMLLVHKYCQVLNYP